MCERLSSGRLSGPSVLAESQGWTRGGVSHMVYGPRSVGPAPRVMAGLGAIAAVPHSILRIKEIL